MKVLQAIILVILSILPSALFAQDDKGIDIDYNNPKTYILGGIKVEGNTYFGDQQIIQLSGLQVGKEIKIPSDELSSVVKKLWMQNFFKEVSIYVDSLSSQNDKAYLLIKILERPRVSAWIFSGVSSGDKKDIQERLKLRRGREFSDYVAQTSVGIIKRFYEEKGFLNAKIKVRTQKDSIIKNAIKVYFDIDKGKKVKVKKINFIGADALSEFKMASSMKKTKSARYYNFFNSKKFNPKEYPNDKKSLISAFNEAGYRNAKIVKDSIYTVKPNRLGIDLYIDQGNKYYFRNITWTGNSVYTTDELNALLQIKKGDVYDLVNLQKRLTGSGKPSDLDISKLYRDNGYLFFNVQPVEVNIKGDSVDVELRIVEGKQAKLNNIVITGNNITHENVIRRQLFTRPGYLFSQSDFERSIREIASMQLFDAEAIMDPTKGYSIVPNQLNNTVDISYNVTEKPSSQLELSGGWGAGTFVGTVGVSFNNFSTRNLFNKKAWHPVPLGDAQNLSIRFQTNGTYYTSLSASFAEPWLFGNKPTSLSASLYYTRQTNSIIALNFLNSDKVYEVYGFSMGLGKRLKWPDNYFVLYNSINWQTYRLTNWDAGYFIFSNGTSHNLSYTFNISRNSTDQALFPRQGSNISFSLQFTPPYSLFRRTDIKDGKEVSVNSWRDINYNNWSAKDRYKWIEYHKWTFSADFYQRVVGDLILRTRAMFGYLGYYNRKWGYSPFESFLVGGDGMSGYNTYGNDIISLRGYQNYSLTPRSSSMYNSVSTYSGNVYDKFTLELRYPILLQGQTQVFALTFLEGGNAWVDLQDFNPFQIKRSAGVGVRIFLPIVGLLGVDWAWGFDDPNVGGNQFHVVIGREF